MNQIAPNECPAVTSKHEAGGRDLSFWIGDPFEYDGRFRPFLTQMVAALGSDVHFYLSDWQEDEDCVDGHIVWKDRTIAAYY